MKQLYRVYYEETVQYEDYVEAMSSVEAKTQFVNTLKSGTLSPTDIDIIEFEAEVCLEKDTITNRV